MIPQASSYKKQTLKPGISFSGVSNQNFTKHSNQSTKSDISLSKADIVIWAVSSALFVAATPDSLQNKDYTTIVNKDVLVDKKRVVVYGSTTSSLPWLKSFYDNAHNAESAKQILPLIAGIKELFSEKKYDTVNDILLEMDFKKLSHTAMVAFISATFPARHKLNGWPLSAQLVKLHLLSAGLEADEILHGIV